MIFKIDYFFLSNFLEDCMCEIRNNFLFVKMVGRNVWVWKMCKRMILMVFFYVVFILGGLLKSSVFYICDYDFMIIIILNF